MKLAVIVINYNKYEKTIECIESIENSEINDEYKIYLLDNNTTNNSVEILKNKFKDHRNLEMIESNENLGYARGNNLCLEKAYNEGYNYALISNNDIIYEKNTIQKLKNDIKEMDNIFIVAPKVEKMDKTIQKSIKIKCPSFIKYICTETYLSHIFKEKNYSKEISELSEVYWVAGCCFLVDIKKFHNIDYFDKYIFLYYEEYILSEKCRQNKLKIYFDPSVSVKHHHGASMGDVNVNIFLEHLKSEMYFWIKYRKMNKFKTYILYNIRKLEIKISLKKRNRSNEYKTFKDKSNLIMKEINKVFR